MPSYHCDGCPYRRFASIAPRQVKKAEIAIVVANPEVHEIVERAPIAGLGKQVVQKLCEQVGLPKWEDLYITSAVLCRGPSKQEHAKEALEACTPRVVRELAECAPKIIITLGNTALRVITGQHTAKITQVQGQIVASKYDQLKNSIIIPTYHPGKVLRDPAAYKSLFRAFKYASDICKTGELKNPGHINYHVVDSKLDAIEKARFLIGKNFRFCTADIETGGMNARLSKILCMGIAYSGHDVIIYPDTWLEYAKPVFVETVNTLWGWHNGKFDSEFLYNKGFKVRFDHDTMLMHYTKNENPGTHDLEQLAVGLLGAKPWEAEVKKHAGGREVGYTNVPRDILYKYLSRDCAYDYQLAEYLLPRVEADPFSNRLYHTVLLPASKFLQEVERRGVWVSLPNLHAYGKTLEEEKAGILQEIEQQAKIIFDADAYVAASGAKTKPAKFSPTSPKQVKWLIYDGLGIPAVKKLRFKKKTDKDTIKAIVERDGDIPILTSILKLRSVQKTLSTYVTGIDKRIDVDGRVHSSYLIHGTATGRLSSRGPNMQNIPSLPVIRSIFQAPPGRMLVEADYSNAELRMLAHLSGDQFLYDVFTQGRDLHEEVRVGIYGPRDQFNDRQLKLQRMAAKTLNFGIPYGRGADSIALQLDCAVAEAQDMIDKWFQRMPQAAQFLKNNAAAVAQGLTLVTPLGRRRRYGLVTPTNLDELQNEARNFPMQSTASDMTLLSGIKLQPIIREWNAWVLNLVHDSILTECDDKPLDIYNTAKEVIEQMMDTPRRVLKSKIPFIAECKVGTAWGDLHEVPLEELKKKIV